MQRNDIHVKAFERLRVERSRDVAPMARGVVASACLNG
jgi:hypothetical protein